MGSYPHIHRLVHPLPGPYPLLPPPDLDKEGGFRDTLLIPASLPARIDPGGGVCKIAGPRRMRATSGCSPCTPAHVNLAVQRFSDPRPRQTGRASYPHGAQERHLALPAPARLPPPTLRAARSSSPPVDRIFYCTLCGSAQAYLTDDVPGFQPVLRTSGLLARSNKLTYDVSTWSAIDTFTGEALSGPLRRAALSTCPFAGSSRRSGSLPVRRYGRCRLDLRR